MPFFFADQGALVKQPAQESWLRRSTVKVKPRKVRHATSVTHASLLMKAHP